MILNNNIFEKVALIISEHASIDIENIVPDSSLSSLNLDSLDILEISLAVEIEFAILIPEYTLAEINNVGELCRVVQALISMKRRCCCGIDE